MVDTFHTYIHNKGIDETDIYLSSHSAGKPQSLFAKLGKKSYEQSSAAEEASAPREQTLA